MQSSVPRFALFLRPFSTTRKLSVRNPYKSLGFLWPGAPAESDNIDIETLLSDAFHSENPLIGLGKPGEAVGVGRIAIEGSEWQRAIQTLAQAAQSIFVIPSDHDGTRWELDYLREQNLLSKSVFVMPPNASDQIIHDWERSRGQLPIYMPPYSKKGMLYTLDSVGKLQSSESLNVGTTAALVSRIKRVSNSSRDLVASNLSDRPGFRFLGWLGISMILVPILGLIVWFLILLLLQK